MKKIFLSLFIIFQFSFLLAQVGGNWSSLGPIAFPTNVSGQINGIGRTCQIKFHATNSQKIYAVSASGGLYMSNNNGTNWSVMGTDKLPGTACSSVCVDYTNDNIIYLSTGDANYYGDGFGIWKTTDGGQTWAQANTNINNRMALEILMHPTDHNTLVAATSDGIWRTTDAGATWTEVHQGGNFTDMIAKPVANSLILYACSHDEFFRSADFGLTWTNITNGVAVPNNTGDGMRLAVSAANPSVVYLGMIANEGKILKSTDSGISFSTVYDNPSQSLVGYDAGGGGQGNYNFDIEADPTNANRVYVAAHVVWRSDDGGANWTQLTDWWADCHTDMHHLKINPYNTQQIFNANDGGIFISTDLGDTWADKSNGLEATEIYHAGQSPIRKDMISIGTQDNGELYYSGTSWKTNRGGDWGPHAIFNYQEQNTVYYINNGERRDVILNGGDQSINLPVVPSGNTQMAFSHLKPLVGFAGTDSLVRTKNITNASPNWTLIKIFGNQIKSLEYSVADSNVLYVITDNSEIHRTDNALAPVPAFVSYPLPAASNTSTSIATIATDINKVFITCGSKVYVSNNQGATWTNITNNLPNVNYFKIYHDRFSTTEAVYVGSAKGVYYRDNSMSGWLNYSQNLPTIADITDFMLYNNGTSAAVLRVSYYGRGVWETGLNTSLAPVAYFGSDVQNVCMGDSVHFFNGSSGSSLVFSWTFTGGTPATSTAANPAIVYYTPGTYNVSLTVTNANGSDSYTQNAYIHVLTPQSLPLSEGFQANNFAPANWTLVDAAVDNAVWKQSDSVGGFSASTKSAYFNNFDHNSNGMRDELQTPHYDFSMFNSANLSFDVAYCRYSNDYYDSLAVGVSIDCGKTFDIVYYKGNSDLATAPDNGGSAFVPQASEWRTETVNLANYLGNSDVVVSFQNCGHWGQYVYIDNVNIQGTPCSSNFSSSSTSSCTAPLTVDFNASTNCTLPISVYSWNFGDGTPYNTLPGPSHVYANSGIYTVTLIVTLSNGAKDTLQMVNYITVGISGTAVNISQAGNNLTASLTGTGYTYQWFLNGNVVGTAQTYTPTASGNYTVMVTDVNGCNTTSSPFNFIMTGLDNSIIQSLNIFPNPTQTNFSVQFTAMEKSMYKILIYNSLGQEVYAQNIGTISGNCTTEIPFRNVPQGAYLVKIQSEKGSISQTIVKE